MLPLGVLSIRYGRMVLFQTRTDSLCYPPAPALTFIGRVFGRICSYHSDGSMTTQHTWTNIGRFLPGAPG